MCDFVEEQFQRWDKQEITSEQFVNLVEYYRMFLKRDFKLGDFIECDKDGNILEEPKIENDHHGSFFKMQTDFHKEKEHQKSKDRVLFKGFELVEMSRNFNIIANTEKDCQVFASKFKEKFYKCKEFTTVEDLIKCELVLTPTAQKLIGL